MKSGNIDCIGKYTKMTNNSINNVIDNAFDFLETAIEQFTEQPKYSVINFCAAIELILKARLIYEHWSLIVSAKYPDIKAFKSGNFKSIGFRELIPRIQLVTGETISKDIIDCFNGLANHRNKMVHFFHEAQSETESKKLLEDIAIEQCNGWFFLRRLLEKWDFIFSTYNQKIDYINYSMKNHDIYLDTVFERIKPEIKLAKSKGATFRNCSRCHKEASEELKITDNLYECKCRVCLLVESLIKITCPSDECNKTIEINEINIDNLECQSCHYKIDKNQLSKILDTNPCTQDNYFDHTQKNCAMCNSMGTVIQHNDNYICMNCLFLTDHIEYCEWCNEAQIGGGDLEMSYHSGCEFCDGHADWTKDD